MFFLEKVVKNVSLVTNPLRSNSDQRQISLCYINAFLVKEVVRIKDMITQANMNSVDRLKHYLRLCYKSCVTTRKENLQCDVGNRRVKNKIIYDYICC